MWSEEKKYLTLYGEKGSERESESKPESEIVQGYRSLQFTKETEMPLEVAGKRQAELQDEGKKLCEDHRGFCKASSNSGNHQAS